MNDRTTSSGDAADRLSLVPLTGSDKPSAEIIAPALTALAPENLIEVTIILRRREQAGADAAASRLSRDEFAARLGAAPVDADLVKSTLTSLGLVVLSTDLPSRRIRVSGTATTMARVFGTDLEKVKSRANDGSETEHRNRSGYLMIPAVLEGVVTAVLGLDDRPQARAEFRIAESRAVTVSYTPLELAKIYGFPEKFDGAGETIAIIELGGGFAQSELDTYFSSLGITGPKITAVGVDGATNVAGKDPGGADGEVLLDIEIAGALSPGADIVVYFAPNTDAGFIDAVSEATHAKVTPTSMSISWGQSEDGWTAQARSALDDAFIDAAALGVTVTAAAGDNGSSDGSTDGRDHADFPASSPHVLGCGGTSLHATASIVRSETVWNNGSGRGATGGGISDVFALPDWQRKAGIPHAPKGTGGRGIPDVAAVADPSTGYEVLVDGEKKVFGGTSAVAPLWAALIARLAQASGHSFGLIQPTLYGASTATGVRTGFRDITSGNNGTFAAQVGWDACTGLGVPEGGALLTLLARKTVIG